MLRLTASIRSTTFAGNRIPGDDIGGLPPSARRARLPPCGRPTFTGRRPAFFFWLILPSPLCSLPTPNAVFDSWRRFALPSVNPQPKAGQGHQATLRGAGNAHVALPRVRTLMEIGRLSAPASAGRTAANRDVHSVACHLIIVAFAPNPTEAMRSWFEGTVQHPDHPGCGSAMLCYMNRHLFAPRSTQGVDRSLP